MAGVEAFFRLLLEKSWALGVLLLVMCGLAAAVDGRGVALPPIVHEWAIVGTLAGGALIAVSIVNWLSSTVQAFVTTRLQKRREEGASAKNAVQNLQTMTREEMEALVSMLRQPGRFEVHAGAHAYGLVNKDILKVVQTSGYSKVICEIRPPVLAIGDALIRDFELWLTKNPKRDELGGNGW